MVECKWSVEAAKKTQKGLGLRFIAPFWHIWGNTNVFFPSLGNIHESITH